MFLGGDTDTIASMAGSLSGAYLGEKALPRRWCARMLDEDITPGSLAGLARQLSLHPGPNTTRTGQARRPAAN